MFRHAYDGNWKVYFENLCDAAHPLFTHRSSIEAAQQQSDDVHSDGTGEIAIRQMRQNGAPYSFWESQVGIWTYPNGHSYLGDYHDDLKLVAALKDPVFRDYIAALEKNKGKAETKRILEVRRWNSNIYPNVSLMSQFQQLRVVHPIAVNRTVVHTYSFRLKGAPEQMFRNTISFANIVNGTGSLGAHRRPRDLQSSRHGHVERRRRVAADRPRLSERRARYAWRPARQELDQRGLYPQHARCLARAHDRQAGGAGARRLLTVASHHGQTTQAQGEDLGSPAAPGTGARSARGAPRCEGARHKRAASGSCCTRRGCSTRPGSTTGSRCSRADGWYWVPSEPDQDNPHDTVSLIYDDRRLLETRVRRLASPRIYSQEPRSRTSRIIGNVSIEDSSADACTVRSKFVMIEYRRESQRLFAGTAFHRLVQARWRNPDRLQARRPGQLRRAARRHRRAVLTVSRYGLVSGARATLV